jgi:iron-sulfur cluster assembly protein
MAITMTEAAQLHVARNLTARRKGIGVRLGVKTTGCSGLSYLLEFVEEALKEDRVFDVGTIKVFVDPKSLKNQQGTEHHYVKEGINEGFEFRNPNVKNECGCGESFHV